MLWGNQTKGHTMFSQKCSQVAAVLQEVLDLPGEWLGRAMGFMQQRSKLTAAVFVQTLVLVLQPHIHEISPNSASLRVPYRLRNGVTMQFQKHSRSKCGCSIRALHEKNTPQRMKMSRLKGVSAARDRKHGRTASLTRARLSCP